MDFNYGICGGCGGMRNFFYMNYCNFCKKNICEKECDCENKIIPEKYLERDQNDNFIKPDDYNCKSCNKQQRRIEMVDEILKLVPKRNIKKCKQLIEEIIEEIGKK